MVNYFLNEMNSIMTNIDPAEVEKFNAQAHRWWDKAGEFKPLHELNPLRLSFVQSHIALDGKRVMDVGCGGGILAESLAITGANVTGIDMAENVLKVAKMHALSSKLDIDYQQTTAEAAAETMPGQFDVVTCMELLEHVPDPQSLIKACATLVKPGGKLFFSTINRNVKAYLMSIVGAEYIMRMLPKGTHDYDKFIKPSELEAWLSEANVNLKQLKGMSYQPLSKNFKLSDNVSVNYLAFAELD
jgi:2-polyprenyl-6-hydroxyphenyl methylase / 3-demethylubiquinone-9 3-methyltransferase